MNSSGAQTAGVFWLIWLAILGGLPMILFFAGGGWPSGEAELGPFGDPLVFVGVGTFFASQAVRWLVVPRMQTLAALLAPAVVGMALAESSLMIGAFVVDDAAVLGRQLLCVLGFLGVLSFAPVYALGRSS